MLTHVSRHRGIVDEQFGQAKVCDLDEAQLVDVSAQNVLQFEIAVTNVVVVKVLDPTQNLK